LNGDQKGATKGEKKPSQKGAKESIWRLWKIERSLDEKVIPIGQAQRPFAGL
jgi:hypothetical protein